MRFVTDADAKTGLIAIGELLARQWCMRGIRSFRELIAWRLAYELRRKVVPLLYRTLKVKDFDLHKQVRKAARSAPANVAEGFGRYKHKVFANFVRIAKGSVLELMNHFQEAFDEGYLTKAELGDLEHAARKTLKVMNGLLRYLDSTPDVE